MEDHGRVFYYVAIFFFRYIMQRQKSFLMKAVLCLKVCVSGMMQREGGIKRDRERGIKRDRERGTKRDREGICIGTNSGH